MADLVPFKVYLYWKDSEKPEVRRFGVANSVIPSFHKLNAKIQEVYTGLRNKTYSLFWKDEDGDNVIISSDDEVMTALQAISGNIIKLYVYCKAGKTKDENANEPMSAGLPHNVVCCNVCDAPVFGFWYKCTTCLDFGLCSRCENAGRHLEHSMVRVPVPVINCRKCKKMQS